MSFPNQTLKPVIFEICKLVRSGRLSAIVAEDLICRSIYNYQNGSPNDEVLDVLYPKSIETVSRVADLPYPTKSDTFCKSLVDTALDAVKLSRRDHPQLFCEIYSDPAYVDLINTEVSHYSITPETSDIDDLLDVIFAHMAVAENLQMPDVVTDYTREDLLMFDCRSLRLIRDTYAYKIGMYVTLRDEVALSIGSAIVMPDMDQRKRL